MSTEKMVIEPPRPIEKFLEEFTKSGLQVDRSAPVIWLPHPNKPGQFMVAVPVKDKPHF